jgi:Insertion element 4 transposase N-terminal
MDRPAAAVLAALFRGEPAADGAAVPRPSEKALRDLRRRLGPAPLKALFEVWPGRWRPRTPQGFASAAWRLPQVS